MGVAAVPLLLAGGGQALSAINTNRTARRQDRAMADLINNQREHQRQAAGRINAGVDRLSASSPAADRAAALAEYIAQIRANQANVGGLGNQPGRTSSAFADAVGQALATAAGETEQRMGWMATQDAAGRQREREERDRVGLATDVGLIGRAARGQRNLDNMRASNIQRNPWLDAASQVMMGLAQGGVGAPSGNVRHAATPFYTWGRGVADRPIAPMNPVQPRTPFYTWGRGG